MSKFIPMDLLKSLSGKVCGHSDTYFANRKGTRYTGKICFPRTKPFSAEELARQTKFTTITQQVATIMADPTQRAAYETAFLKQSKYTTLRGYIFAQEYKKLGA